MAFTWRIIVTGRDGVGKTTITPESGVARIDSLSTDGMGSCQEATLTALPSAIDLEVRDRIQVQYSLDDGLTWKSNLWSGVITSAPSSRMETLGTYRAVGLKQRLYERIVTSPVAGGDVAAMAYSLINSAMVDGVLGLDLPFGGFDDLGFTAGDRAPNLETYGDALDALAALVGSFTVPPSTTYTYADKTWSAGDTVPAVRWGVDPQGQGFFGRPTGDPITFDESSRRVEVAWGNTSAEQVNDRVTLVYASELTSGGVLRIGATEDPDQEVIPLFAQGGSGDYEADRVVVVDYPIDFMEDDPDTQTWGGSITNPANAFDGDPASYAEFAGSGDFIYVRGSDPSGAIARIRLRINDQTIGISATATPPNVEIILSFWDGLSQIATVTYLIDPTTTTAERTLVLPVLLLASVASAVDTYRVTVYGASGVRCYALELFTPIDDDVTRLVEVFTRIPHPIVASVSYWGLLPTPSSFIAGSRRSSAIVTDLSGTTVTAAIDRQEISITPEEGILTTVYLGQAFASDDEAMRVVLERLARRAVKEGGPRA